MIAPIKDLPLICLVGPTGAGKTVAAIELAVRLNGEIVCADSRQVFRRMDIGTAKPTVEQRTRVRHHLLDVADSMEDFSVVRFRREALAAIDEIESKGKLPFLVGGTGQYVEAMTKGLSPAPAPPDPALRDHLQRILDQRGPAALIDKLRELDPSAGAGIDLKNPRRVMRALEVQIQTGQSIRQLERPGQPARRALVLGIDVPRPELRERIRRRVDQMFRDGFVDEVRGLWSSGYAYGSAASTAIGYAQVFAYLLGRCRLAEAQQATVTATHGYARRQVTWFKNRESVHWIAAGDEMLDAMTRQALDFLSRLKTESS